MNKKIIVYFFITVLTGYFVHNNKIKENDNSKSERTCYNILDRKENITPYNVYENKED